MKAVGKLVRELVFPRVDFHLTLRKEGLQILSIKEVEKLVEDFSIMIQLSTMSSAYMAQVEMTLNGVTISTKNL